ncbi:hypothetical protein HED60_20140 [Planctomycetales bacterium ZRK34]|nr:hypothetical protein HED60_20140 [Planctomycetales bacterium ZRK34]
MRFRLSVTLLMMALCVATAQAVKPGSWVHQTEADFAEAELEHTIVTNLGEVQLALDTTGLAELEGDDSIIYDIARLDDGRVFLAVGAEGKLVQLDGEKVNVITEFEGSQVFSLAATKDGLWVAISGAESRLELRSGQDMAVKRTIALKDVRYVWDILLDKDRMWLATGAEGQVLMLDPSKEDAAPTVALDTEQANVLCLGIDGKRNVYAGTDGEGLIYRISPQDGGKFSTFVIYDAAEPEIGALIVTDDGTVFAGTADASQARPGRLEEASAEQKGRLEKLTKEPTEPKLPNVPPKPEPKADKPAKPDAPAPKPNAEAAPAEASDSPAPEKPAQAAAPTPEQYDQLRTAVAERLEAARKSGRINLQSDSGSRSAVVQRLRSRASRAGGPSRGATPSKEGNAIYRISADGFVREVFRESVMILRIVKVDSDLLVATGNEGQLYRVSPDTGETTILADLEPQQVPALLDLGGGQVMLGTANPGRIIRLADQYAPEGTLTSATLDAQQISLWGKLQILASTPGKTTIAMQTRSGNVGDPDAGSWSDWSQPQKIDPTGASYHELLSPSARFLQYRLILHADQKTTPTVLSVALKYLMPNMPPSITSIKAEYDKPKPRGDDADAPAPQSTLKIEWEAADANEDALTYSLEARPFGSDAPWVAIAKDLTTANAEWDTRTTPDGRYTLRVTASDAADNIPSQVLSATRRSDPITVDNTPPDLANLRITPAADSAAFTVDITDAASPIHELRYAVDSADDWNMALPNDLIYDSTSESVVVKIPDLAPGRHVLTVRAADAQGNTRYLSQTFEIKAKP